MVGMDTFAHTFNVPEWYDKADQLEKDAVIIHYAGEKPWYQWNLNRCRESGYLVVLLWSGMV